MTSFKSGSGDLDFGSGSDEKEDLVDSENSSSDDEELEEKQEQTRSEQVENSSLSETEPSQLETNSPTEPYPYFVRRSNVTDEREHRIEVHLRKEILSQESSFRNELAEHLETDEISKTDAREFALKYAFQNSEGVAELLREEGFGILD